MGEDDRLLEMVYGGPSTGRNDEDSSSIRHRASGMRSTGLRMAHSPTIFHLPQSRGVSSASLGTSAVIAVALLAQ